jgi:hypothetical protein
MIVVFTAHTARARIRCPCTLQQQLSGQIVGGYLGIKCYSKNRFLCFASFCSPHFLTIGCGVMEQARGAFDECCILVDTISMRPKEGGDGSGERARALVLNVRAESSLQDARSNVLEIIWHLAAKP